MSIYQETDYRLSTGINPRAERAKPLGLFASLHGLVLSARRLQPRALSDFVTLS